MTRAGHIEVARVWLSDARKTTEPRRRALFLWAAAFSRKQAMEQA